MISVLHLFKSDLSPRAKDKDNPTMTDFPANYRVPMEKASVVTFEGSIFKNKFLDNQVVCIIHGGNIRTDIYLDKIHL